MRDMELIEVQRDNRRLVGNLSGIALCSLLSALCSLLAALCSLLPALCSVHFVSLFRNLPSRSAPTPSAIMRKPGYFQNLVSGKDPALYVSSPIHTLTFTLYSPSSTHHPCPFPLTLPSPTDPAKTYLHYQPY
jgi:hypothetical protein